MSVRPIKRIRSKPGISANELARYLVAGDHAREGIIRRSREIATAPVIRYRDLRNGLSAYLGDTARPQTVLTSLEDMLNQKLNDLSNTPFIREDAQKSLEALDSFYRFRNQLGGIGFRKPPKWAGALAIEGVAVNVFPDLALVQDSRSEKRYGVALFRLAKGDDNESEAAASKRADIAKYVSTLAFMQAAAHCLPDYTAHYSLCMSIDIQNREIFQASRSQTTRIRNIQAACRAIARTWDDI